jgi:hypothetical protein
MDVEEGNGRGRRWSTRREGCERIGLPLLAVVSEEWELVMRNTRGEQQKRR